MNSEELELSLRTEFESYLKDVLADLQQEFSQFQEKIESEFDKHKSQLDAIIQDFSSRVPSERELSGVFKETVIEHLRLARDEGARITATAIAEAEDLHKDSAPQVGVSELRDAINEITQQTSQASILKALVNHAAQFTPRGAFFIIKNEHFVGWRVFGEGVETDEQTVREIFFPVASSTVLGESIRSLSPVETTYGTYASDSIYLNKLEFGQPGKMFAIPLIVRGRGVAVLYADYGTEGESVNVEALETLVRIAGLTVELIASSQSAKTAPEEPQTAAADQRAEVEEAQQDTAEENYYAQPQTVESAPEPAAEESKENEAYPQYHFESVKFEETALEPETYQISNESAEDAIDETADEDNFDAPVEVIDYDSQTFDYAQATEEVAEMSDVPADVETEASYTLDESYPYEDSQKNEDSLPVQTSNYWNAPEGESVQETYSWNQSEESNENIQDYSTAAEPELPPYDYQPAPVNNYSETPTNNYNFEEAPQTFEQPDFEENKYEPVQTSSYETNQEYTPAPDSYNSFSNENGKAENFYSEPAPAVSEPAASAPVRSRFSDRNVDLPIEVSEDERRLHNDARRFARLLVSEIKLYNEQKVKEGREIRDLYERLREAIDRSREMYDKRVQPPVAAKFDYFHYELVNTLAEGEEGKLGESYPGAAV